MSITSYLILQLTPWLTAIGYSLCYGTIIVKMFRIFYIIHNLFSPSRVSLNTLKYIARYPTLNEILDKHKLVFAGHACLKFLVYTHSHV